MNVTEAPRRAPRLVRTMRHAAIGVTVSVSLASCACPHANGGAIARCGPAWVRTELYFGMDIPPGPAWPGGGRVTDKLWQVFVDEQITPRFPDGLSILSVRGQWRDGEPESASPRIIREESRVVVIFRDGDAPPVADARAGHATASEDARIEAIRAAYKALFNQNSVMRVESTARVRFD